MGVRRLVLLVVGFVVLVLFVFGAWAAGASVVSTSPWGTDGGMSPAQKTYGECNEVFISGVSGATANDGFYVQLACQAMVPVGDTVYTAQPFLATGHRVYWSGSAWSLATDNEWDSVGGNIASNTMVSGVSRSACAATSSGASPVVWSGAAGSAAMDCTSGALLQPEPTALAGCGSGGATCATTASQVQSLWEGPSSNASDGHAYYSVALTVTEVVEEQLSYYNGTSVVQNSTSQQVAYYPLYPLGQGSGTPCPASSAMISQTDANKWYGTDLGNSSYWNNEPALEIGGTIPSYVSQDSGSASSLAMHLDNITCEAGQPQVMFAGMPSNFYTGGAATNGVLPCTLTNVNGPTVGTVFQKGSSYSFSFSFQGGANQIVVDPADDTTTITTPYLFGGSVYTPGADATIQTVSTSPASVGFSPQISTVTNVQFYCVYQDQVYYWGSSTEAENACVNGVCLGVTPPGANTTNGGGYFSLSACFEDAGFVLNSPSTWVDGGLKDGACVVQWLLIPSASTLSNFTNLFQVSPTGTAPANVGQWLGSLGGFAVNFPAASVTAIQTAASGGCSGGPTIGVDGSNISICSSLAAAGGAASFSLVDSIVTACFCVAMGLMLFHLVRRAITGNAA